MGDSGRNYNCGCGKKYLSYPALYTHIRNKHFGKTPEGTRNSCSNSSKRGRPKRVHEESAEDNSGPAAGGLVELEDLNLLRHLEDNYEGEFELALEYRQLLGDDLAHYYQLLLSREPEERLDPKAPFGLALSVFCSSISRLLGPALCQPYVQFLRTLYQCHREHACEVLAHCLASSSPRLAEVRESLREGPREDLLQGCQLVPLLGDFLFRTYLPVQQPASNLPLAILMFCDLCRWLGRMKLTRIELEVNWDPDS